MPSDGLPAGVMDSTPVARCLRKVESSFRRSRGMKLPRMLDHWRRRTSWLQRVSKRRWQGCSQSSEPKLGEQLDVCSGRCRRVHEARWMDQNGYSHGWRRLGCSQMTDARLEARQRVKDEGTFRRSGEKRCRGGMEGQWARGRRCC
jgi:hypothetical protein